MRKQFYFYFVIVSIFPAYLSVDRRVTVRPSSVAILGEKTKPTFETVIGHDMFFFFIVVSLDA